MTNYISTTPPGCGNCSESEPSGDSFLLKMGINNISYIELRSSISKKNDVNSSCFSHHQKQNVLLTTQHFFGNRKEFGGGW